MQDRHRTYTSGAAAGIMAIAVGAVLQWSLGPVRWDWLSCPANIIVLVLYLTATVSAYRIRRHSRIVRWMMTRQCTLPSIMMTAAALIVLGITSWETMLSCWPFVMLWIWLVTALALTTLRYRQRPCLFLCHAGLFAAIVCATLGHADNRQLRMAVSMSQPRQWAMDAKRQGEMVKLPFSIQLMDFDAEDYISSVSIVMEGKDSATRTVCDTIRVNRPIRVDGWTVYQSGYDIGIDGNTASILMLVRDPWLPAVYCGILMLFIGSLMMGAHIVSQSRWLHDRRKLAAAAGFFVIIVSIVNRFYPLFHNETLMPALRSPWFAPHILIYMFSYAILAIATLTAVCAAVLDIRHGRKQHEANRLAANNAGERTARRWRRTERLTAVGVSLMTIGMITGAVWAKEAWGHYWTWDPKETWAAATWFLFLAHIHLCRPISSQRDGSCHTRQNQLPCCEQEQLSRHEQGQTKSKEQEQTRHKELELPPLSYPCQTPNTRHRLALLILVISFCCLQMCWWGINYLPSARGLSVHTYQ